MRRATPPYIFGNDRLEEQFEQLIFDADVSVSMYVYRWQNGENLKPAILNDPPFPNLLSYLQDKHDGGEFHVMFRRGETMLLSGRLLICPLPSRREAFDAFRAAHR
jgi:hypothetical protein